MPLAALAATGAGSALVGYFVEIEVAEAVEVERVLVVPRMEVLVGGLSGGRRQNPTHLEIRQHKKGFFRILKTILMVKKKNCPLYSVSSNTK